jgi:hypothetical protein
LLLRRITEHVKAQNWTAVGLDFVIVVVGVFVGIQVSNWNEARQEERAAREYIVRVQEDLLANQQDMKTREQYFARVRNHGIAALNALDDPPESLGEPFIIDSFLASFALSRPIGRDTYDELLAVGAINTIPDVVVRRRLAEYYRGITGAELFISQISTYPDALRRSMPYEAQASLRSRGCNATFAADEKGAQTANLPENCSLDLSDEQISNAVMKLLEADLEPELTTMLAVTDLKLNLMQTVTDRAQSVRDYLEETK